MGYYRIKIKKKNILLFLPFPTAVRILFVYDDELIVKKWGILNCCFQIIQKFERTFSVFCPKPCLNIVRSMKEFTHGFLNRSQRVIFTKLFLDSFRRSGIFSQCKSGEINFDFTMFHNFSLFDDFSGNGFLPGCESEFID